MKENFIVSMHRKLWVAESKRLFLVDSYLHHLLEKDGSLLDYDAVRIAEPIRSSKQDLIRDHDYVDAKLRKYTPILASRLDRIHGTSYGEWFWSKCFSLSLLRHVTFCYGMFKSCERDFQMSEHCCRVLSERSYYTPIDFNEHYRFFKSEDHAQEQLFSVYIRLFYPSLFEEVDDNFSSSLRRLVAAPLVKLRLIDRLFKFPLNRAFESIKAKLFKFSLKKVLRRLLLMRNPTIGVFGSYFKLEYSDQLLFKSLGKIRFITFRSDFPRSESVDLAKRDVLSEADNASDRFDQYFFGTLRYAMPNAFVEDWDVIAGYYQEHFKTYKNIRYVTCEDWIGNMYSSIALAVLHQQGVKHIYNEHNFLSRPFIGNSSKYLFPLVDVFATLGWFESGIPNLIKAGSLFKWMEEQEVEKEYKILFMASLPQARAPEISACYGDAGPANVARYFNFNKSFFAALGGDTLSQILYRAYPAEVVAHWGGAYDEAYVMRDVLPRFRGVDDSSTPGSVLIQKSRLIIVSYLATAFLQALLADIPTVFFWNKSTRYLEDAYAEIFDDLIEAEICQTDPVAAAVFIDKIKDTPELWWFSEPVRQARQKFIDKYLGPPEALIDYLLECAAAH